MDNNELGTNLAEVGTDAISRADAIKIVQNRCKRYTTACVLAVTEIKQLPPIQPTGNLQKLADEIASFKRHVKSDNSVYLTGYLCALSVVEGMIEDMREVTT